VAPAGGWPMAPLPGTTTSLTAAQEQHIRTRLAHVLRFYRRYAALAIADHQATGVPAAFTLAQGGVESGWGRHMPGNMLFGVKADEHRVSPADRQLVWTSETVTDPRRYDQYEHHPAEPIIDHATGQQATDSHGRPLYTIQVRLWFRRFASEADAIANHSRLLRTNRRYAQAFQHTADPIAFARAVAQAGYATGRDYEEALVSAIQLVDRVAAYALRHPEDDGTRPHENAPETAEGTGRLAADGFVGAGHDQLAGVLG
jgi:hypothetical protein